MTTAHIDLGHDTRMDSSKHLRQVLTAMLVILKKPREVMNLQRLIRTRKRSTLEVCLPWMPFSVIDALDGKIGSGTRVFEYGSGGSTLWLAQRAGEVVTVEHDERWYRTVKDAIGDRKNARIILADDLSTYADTINQCGTRQFDVVIVDGRERMACIGCAMERLSPGGLLVLDDSRRLKYSKAAALLTGWPRKDYFGFVPCKDEPGRTTIWSRPVQ